MTPRALKTALAVSVLLNVFLIGAGASAGYLISHAAKERAAALRQGTPLFVAARRLDEPTQARLRQKIHAAARVAAPDFRAAREARAAAVDLARAPTFDRTAIQAKLDEARADETRGRLALEAAVLDFMQAAPADQRAILAPTLKGRRLNTRSRPAARPEHPEAPAQPAG